MNFNSLLTHPQTHIAPTTSIPSIPPIPPTPASHSLHHKRPFPPFHYTLPTDSIYSIQYNNATRPLHQTHPTNSTHQSTHPRNHSITQSILNHSFTKSIVGVKEIQDNFTWRNFSLPFYSSTHTARDTHPDSHLREYKPHSSFVRDVAHTYTFLVGCDVSHHLSMPIIHTSKKPQK